MRPLRGQAGVACAAACPDRDAATQPRPQPLWQAVAILQEGRLDAPQGAHVVCAQRLAAAPPRCPNRRKSPTRTRTDLAAQQRQQVVERVQALGGLRDACGRAAHGGGGLPRVALVLHAVGHVAVERATAPQRGEGLGVLRRHHGGDGAWCAWVGVPGQHLMPEVHEHSNLARPLLRAGRDHGPRRPEPRKRVCNPSLPLAVLIQGCALSTQRTRLRLSFGGQAPLPQRRRTCARRLPLLSHVHTMTGVCCSAVVSRALWLASMRRCPATATSCPGHSCRKPLRSPGARRRRHTSQGTQRSATWTPGAPPCRRFPRRQQSARNNATLKPLDTLRRALEPSVHAPPHSLSGPPHVLQRRPARRRWSATSKPLTGAARRPGQSAARRGRARRAAAAARRAPPRAP